MLLPVQAQLETQMMCSHILAVSELKSQRLTQRVLTAVLDLSKNLVLASRLSSATTTACTELIAALSQKRQKLLQFRVADSNEVAVSQKVNQVMMEIDQVVAPRREKYALPGNAMAHFANEYKSRCIDYHR